MSMQRSRRDVLGNKIDIERYIDRIGMSLMRTCDVQEERQRMHTSIDR